MDNRICKFIFHCPSHFTMAIYIPYLFLFLRGKKEALPEQKNDGVPDYQAAEHAWNTEKLIDKSFIRETFYGQWRSVLSK